MKKHFKKASLIVGGLLLGSLALPLSAYAFFSSAPSNPNTPPTPPSSSVNYQSIGQAVEKAVGNVIVYPMEQFADVIKYTFDTRPTQAALQTQSRFPLLPASQSITSANVSQISSQLNDLVDKASVNTQAELANSQPQVCQSGMFGKKNCLATNSADSLLNTDQYQTSEQEQAAQQFLKTASGAYIAMPAPDKSWNKNNADVIRYAAFYKTMQAIGSVANHNLAYAYAMRMPNGSQPSQMALDKAIMTGDATNPTFWSEINKVPVVGQLVEIANYMPAIAVGIDQEDKYLAMINNSMAAMLVQQNVLSESFAGKALYANAETAPAADDSNDQSNNPPPSNSGSGNNNSDNSGNSDNSDNSNGGGTANSPADSDPYAHHNYHKPSKSEAADYALKHPGKVAGARSKASSSREEQKNAEKNM